MKLNELAPIITPVNKSRHDYMRKISKKDQRRIGSGTYASAFSSQTHPGTVQKVGRVARDPIKNDPYLQFVDVVQTHQDNPYFPKIYNVRIFTNPKTEESYYRVEMERLHPLNILSTKQNFVLFQKLFNRIPTAEEALYLEGRNGIELFIRTISNAIREEKMSRTKLSLSFPQITDVQLNQAIELLSNIIKINTTTHADIHSDNIMCRIGPTGPQLVITDPFS